MTLYYLTVLAHVIADFFLQTDRIAIDKSQLEPKAFVKHWLSVFVCTLVATHFYGLRFSVLFSFLVSLTHIVIDLLKSCLELNISKKPAWFSMATLVCDQIVHLSLIFILLRMNIGNIDTDFVEYYSNILFYGQNGQNVLLLSFKRYIIILVVYLYVTFGGAVFIRMLVKYIFPDRNQGIIILKSSNTAGRYIGILERALILTLVLKGLLSAVALVLTAKSIARFNELKEKDFAEYYLIGTLASMLIAIIAGLILLKLLTLV